MTWWYEPQGSTIDVYDHTGNLVADGREFDGSGGDPPSVVLDIMRESMDGNQPSAYNQSLLADAATGNIEKGTPP